MFSSLFFRLFRAEFRYHYRFVYNVFCLKKPKTTFDFRYNQLNSNSLRTNYTMPPKRKRAAVDEKKEIEKPVEKDLEVDPEEEVDEKPKNKRGAKKTKKNDEPEEKPVKKGRPAKKDVKEPEEDEEEVEEKPTKKGRGAKKEVKEPEEENEVEEKPAKKGRGAKKEVKEPEEAAEKPAKKGRGAKKETKEDEDEDVPEEKPVRKGRATKKDIKDDNEVDEPEDKPAKKTPRKRGKEVKKDDSEEPESEPEEPPKKTKNAKKEPKKTKEAKPKAEGDKVLKNQTSTNYDNMDFNTCEKHNGKDWNFKISNWNVDGIRAWLKKGGLEYVNYEKPDVFCLQETKCSEEKLPPEVKEVDGYEVYWHCSKKDGYAGVGLYTKTKPLSVSYGMGIEAHDDEGRMITAEFEKFYVISVYVPNAGRGLVTLPKRLEWNEDFRKYIAELNEKKPVIICGDMNVAHSEIDLANPKTNTKNAGFTKEEREGMTEFLSDGYVDTFRELYPDKTKAYTFWSYMSSARSKNIGWRLDYFIVPKSFMENVCDNVIRSEIFGSDHCPLTLFLCI